MRIASCVAVALVIAMAPLASAQNAEAEMLFREGRRLMKQGSIAAACDKFDASERIDPSYGTELNLADCREKNGQSATAWAMFMKAAATAKHLKTPDKQDAEAEARDRARAIEKQLVSLTIHVPDEAVLDELVIKRNDMVIDRGLWDQPVPVDPAEYVIHAEAPGYTAWSETVVVKAKSKMIEVPKLEPAAHDEGDTRKPPRTRKPPPEHVARQHEYRSTAIVLAAVGAGALAIGTGFAVYSNHVETQSDAVCPTTMCTDQHAVDLNHAARVDGWIANISWGIGAVALGGALAAYLVDNSHHNDAVSIAPIAGRDGVGVALGGRF